MAEDKKVILQIEIDNSKSINQIISLKDRIKTLKDEQKQLNLTTLEGRKANEAYNAQIKALTKEQKSLELAVEKTAASMEFEAGSIAHNRAELSRLTAEYKNLANPTKEQTERIRKLTDTLKAQESAIGDNRRNVGNYKEALDSVVGATGAFGVNIGQITTQFGGVTSGLGTVARGFGTLRGAIISTGIGALIVALGSLIAYFTTTDSGATKLAGVMGALGAVTRRITGFFAELGSYISDIASGSKSLVDAFKNLGQIILDNLINRLKAPLVILEAVKDAFKEIAKNGLDADLTPSLKKATDGFIQLNLGITDATDKISELGSEMIKAAEEAYNYALAIDALDDAQRDLNVTNAESEKKVALLLRQAQDRTKTDQQRIALIQQANKIEEDAVNRQISLDRERLKLVSDRNKRESEAINQRLNLQIAEAKSEEEKIELRKKALDISDELAQEEADLRVKIINQETSFISLREKNLNKIAVLEEKIAADKAKREQEELERRKKLEEAINALENQRLANQIKNIDLELQNTKISTDRRIELLRQRADLEIKLETALKNQKLANDELLEVERTAIKEQYDQRRIEIEMATQKAISDIQAKEEAEREKKRQEVQKKLFENINTAAKIANDIINVALQANQAALDETLSQLDEARKQELAKAGNDRVKQQQINRKFDKLAEKEKKESTKKAITLQQVQAIANGATAVTQALASPAGPPISFILAGIAGTLAAVQIAQLEKAKSKLAKGGLIHGPSHASGGVTGTGRFNNVEVEGGEFVVNKKATAANLGLLQQINSLSSPIGFHRNSVKSMATGGILDGGLSARRQAGNVQDSIEQQNQLTNAVKNLPNPIVLVEDINTGQNRNAIVKNRANVTS